MSILIVYNFKNNGCYNLLEAIIKKNERYVLYRSSNTFWIECEYSYIYKLFTTIYNSFNQTDLLTITDNIEAFYVSSGNLDFSIARLNKKSDVTLRKVDFEFLNAEYKLPLFL